MLKRKYPEYYKAIRKRRILKKYKKRLSKSNKQYIYTLRKYNRINYGNIVLKRQSRGYHTTKVLYQPNNHRFLNTRNKIKLKKNVLSSRKKTYIFNLSRKIISKNILKKKRKSLVLSLKLLLTQS